MFEKNAPDIVLLDIMLPELNGLEVLRRIRKTSHTPVIMLTARGDTFDKVSGLDSGADDYLAKPFEIEELLARMRADFERERRFTADVSHELKTPLAVILGHANLLRRWGKHDPDRLEKSLSALIREAHSMEAIIGNLLQMTRLENGRVPLDKTSVAAAEFFNRLIDGTHSYAPHVSFTEHIEVPALYTDEELLYQACTAVISNSVKFAGENAHIELSIRPVLEADSLPDTSAAGSACIILQLP